MKEHISHADSSGVRIPIPDSDTMKKRLTDAGLYAENSGTDAFYERFIREIAGTEKVAGGIVLAYEIAIYEISDTISPDDFPVALSYYRGMFDRVADAVIEKARDAEETKYYMQDLRKRNLN